MSLIIDKIVKELMALPIETRREILMLFCKCGVFNGAPSVRGHCRQCEQEIVQGNVYNKMHT